MGIKLHPLAIPADQLVAKIEERLAAGPGPEVGYECLFFAPSSTRPAMEFELFPEMLRGPGWKAVVEGIVARANSDASDGEQVYFEPYW